MIKTKNRRDLNDKEKAILDQLLSITRKSKELKLLNEKIESLDRLLTYPSSVSPIIISDNMGGGKTRTEKIADLFDIKDKYRSLLTKIELDKLNLINKIDTLDNKELGYLLKLKYVFGMSYDAIANQEYYHKEHAKRKIYQATYYFIDVMIEHENSKQSINS